MKKTVKPIAKTLKRNYLLSILGGIGGVGILQFLYHISPCEGMTTKFALYLLALTFLLAMWICVFVILIQTTIAYESQNKDIENSKIENERLAHTNLLRAVQRLEKKTQNLDDYCRQIVSSIRVHESFVEEMDLRDWQDLLDQSSWSININTKIRNQLVRSDIWTIRQLVSLSVDELMEKTGMGDMSIGKLRQALHQKCKYLHLELLYADANSTIHKRQTVDESETFDPETFIQNALEEEGIG